MSFVRTLATLAAGVAAAKGFDKFRDMGGVAGVQKALQDNPMVANNPQLKGLLDSMSGSAARGGETAQAGLAQLMAGLGTAAATGAGGAAAMLDSLTGSNAASSALEDNAKLMIRAMIMAAKADGHIDAGERARIEAHLTDATPEERAFVAAEMEGPVDVIGLAQQTGDTARAQVYSAAASMCRGDNPAEAQFLAALGGALQLDLATRQTLHAALGMPAPVA